MSELYRARPRPDLPQAERDLLDAEAAIEMVMRGAATRVHLHGFPSSDRIAASMAGSAQRAGVAFRYERHDSGTASIVVGPRLPHPVA